MPGVIAIGVLTSYVLRTLERQLETPLPDVPPISILNFFADQTPIQVPITAAWQKVSVTAPTYALTSDVTLWRKMNLDDWDKVPEPRRQNGLIHLIEARPECQLH